MHIGDDAFAIIINFYTSFHLKLFSNFTRLVPVKINFSSWKRVALWNTNEFCYGDFLSLIKIEGTKRASKSLDINEFFYFKC